MGFENLLSLSVEYFDKQVSGKLMSQLDRGVARITSIINNSGMVFPQFVNGCNFYRNRNESKPYVGNRCRGLVYSLLFS